MKSILTATLAALGLAFATASHAADEPPVDFVKQIKPILAERCVECHHSGALFGELNLQSRKLAFQKRSTGPAIVPGAPERSLFHLVLTLPPKDRKAMPATGHRIPKDEVSLIRRWIQEGAKWPEGEEGFIPAKKAAKEKDV
jgi:mono/diheme cytochrome c family protein